jgi:putative transposase
VGDAVAVITDLCRRHGTSSATYYAWKAKFGGLEVSDAKRLWALEEENARLKRLLADTMLDNAGRKDLLSKNGDACREAGSGRASSDGAGNERAAGVFCRRSGSQKHAVSLVPIK